MLARAMRRPRPTRVLEIGARDVRLLDAKTSAVLRAAPIGNVVVQHGVGLDWGQPLVEVLIPGAERLVIGTRGWTYGWTDPGVVRLPASFLLGGGEWFALVERLGLRPRLREPVTRR
jgi:hypothetical protein